MGKFTVGTLLTVAVACFVPAASAQTFYSLTDLGTFGGSASQAYGINNSGQVVGWANITGDSANHAFLYSNGVMQDLGTLTGNDSQARAISDTGQITGGYSSAPSALDSAAFLYSNGVMKDLANLRASWGWGVNDSGQVVGVLWPQVYNAYLYSNGSIQNIAPAGRSEAFGINNNGQIVGYADNTGFVYTNGVMQDIGNLGGGNATPYAINASGQIAGESAVGATQHAFIYSGGSMKDLGALNSGYSVAYALNNSGQAVGESNQHAFVYSNNALTDLNNTASLPNGWTLKRATGINNAGQIVGIASVNSQDRAFLLTPNLAPSVPAVPPIPTTTPPIATFPQPTTLYNDLPQFMANHGSEFSTPSMDFINTTSTSIQPLIQPGSDQFLKFFADALGDNLAKAAFVSSLASNLYAGLTLDPAAVTKAEINIGIQQLPQGSAAKIDAARVFALSSAATSASGLRFDTALWTLNNEIWGTEVPAQLHNFALDPSDPNYQQVVAPASVLNLLLALPATNNPQLDQVMTEATQSALNCSALLAAANTSYNRYCSAYAAGDAPSAGLQLEALLEYIELYSNSAQATANRLNQTLVLLQSSGAADRVYDLSLMQQLQGDISTNGLTPDTINFFLGLGLSQDDVNGIATNILALNPDQGSLGTFDSITNAQSVFTQSSVPEPSLALLSFAIFFGSVSIHRRHHPLTSAYIQGPP